VARPQGRLRAVKSASAAVRVPPVSGARVDVRRLKPAP
jgi:hypothetical protein